MNLRLNAERRQHLSSTLCEPATALSRIYVRLSSPPKLINPEGQPGHPGRRSPETRRAAPQHIASQAPAVQR